jgi:hypothetical protein
MTVPTNRGSFITWVRDKVCVGNALFRIVLSPMTIGAEDVGMPGALKLGCIDEYFFPYLQRRHFSTSTFTGGFGFFLLHWISGLDQLILILMASDAF